MIYIINFLLIYIYMYVHIVIQVAGPWTLLMGQYIYIYLHAYILLILKQQSNAHTTSVCQNTTTVIQCVSTVP